MSSAVADKITGPRGSIQMKTTEVAQHLSTGESRLLNWLGEILAKVNPYQSGRLSFLKNITAQCIRLAPLSLRGARFFAYARNRLRNLGGESNEIATPRQVGARNDKRQPRLVNQATTKICRRDMRQQFSSLLSLLMMVGLVSSDLYFCLVCPAGRGWEGGGWG